MEPYTYTLSNISDPQLITQVPTSLNVYINIKQATFPNWIINSWNKDNETIDPPSVKLSRGKNDIIKLSDSLPLPDS